MNDKKMEIKDKKKILKIIKKRDESDGAKIMNKIKRFSTTHYTYQKNFTELSKIIEFYEGNIDIWPIKNREKLRNFLMEFSRLLHNYLASVKTFVDNTRRLKQKLSKFPRDYESKVKDLIDKPVIKFLQDLREYCQHREIPRVAAQISVKNTGKKGEAVSEHKLLLESANLLTSFNWKQKAKEYIEQQGEDIDLKKVINEYNALISNFYQYIYKDLDKQYSQEIEELIGMEKEILEALSQQE